MTEKKALNENELNKVSGGSDCINRDELESKIGKVVNFRCKSEGIDCTVRIIKVDVICKNEYYTNVHVCVYAIDEVSYNQLKTKRFNTRMIGLWDCDGVNPHDSGLGYGKNGFRIRIEDGDDAYFY